MLPINLKVFTYRIAFFVLLLTNALSALSVPAYKISYLTADNGLTQNLVDQIYKDSHGFMWIATWNGLDRYDGYQFVHFSSRNATNPLRSDAVHCIEEDNNGNLWIGTESGLDFMNFRNGEITHAEDLIGSKYRFTSQSILIIRKDKQGDLWIGHDKGLARIHIEGDDMTAEEVVNGNLGVGALLFYNESVYIGQENAVDRIIKGSNGKYHRVNASSKLTRLNGIVNTLFLDNNTMWIGTNNGLYRYEATTEALTTYLANAGNSKSLSSGYVSDIARNQEGQLIIGTLIGLNIYDYRTDEFSHISTERNQSGIALNNNFINCLYVDDKSVWVGTEKGGINLLHPDQNIFSNVANIASNPASLSKNPVNAIFEDKAGDLWVGTVEGGLNLLKKGSNEFIHYYSRPGDSRSLSHNSVSAICTDYRGDYWFATWGNGINRMKLAEKKSPVFTQYTHHANSDNSIDNDFVAALQPDNNRKGLWIGTRSGLDFLNAETNRFTHILNYLPSDRRIKLVTGMYTDSKQRLWIGTGNGLYCIFLDKTDLAKNRIVYTYFRYTLSNASSHQVEKINTITETRDGKIWFGSNGNGIYQLVMSEDGKMNFANIDERMGLLNNSVYGMLEDETGSLWLSTDKGLCVYDPNKHSFRNYTKADGLPTNQFYWDAYCKGHDGRMYFGSVAGYTVFDPLKATPVTDKNKPTITRITILNEDIYPASVRNAGSHLTFEGSQLTNIELREADKAFSIEFSALSYSFSEKIKYAYRLKGFDNNWTEVAADRRFASYTNLKAGNYTFEIKCTNPDGTWSDDIGSVDIAVYPPFYKTWWFILLSIALVLYGTYRYYLHRVDLLKRQKIHLREMVEQRTQEIQEQKVTLEEQATELKQTLETLMEHQDEISRQNEMLTQQNHEITHQKEQLEELSRKVEEATLDKIGFFTNITHEFRTPITLISGPIERAMKISHEEEVHEQLSIAQRNSKLLLSLINQLMDFRKVDSGKMEIVKMKNNFIEFLDDLILPFQSLVSERNITIKKVYHIAEPEFPFDRDNLQKVIGNLLSNAAKFTPDGGVITVNAETYEDKSDLKERLYVSVSDSGKGIHPEDMEKIFDHFYQSKHNENYSMQNQTGTGIGLYLTKRIIELHNGTLSVVNLKSGGACFRFTIPIDRGLSTFVSTGGNSAQMLVANESVEEDFADSDIAKGKPVLLIVEDNQDMRQYVRSILEDEYTILEAANGAVGLELTNRYQPDLIISDIMMPVMDGLTFCKKVKSNFATSHIPVILLTAKSASDTQIESFHLGADAFLVKPFNEDLLKAMIRNLNERRQRSQLHFSDSMDVDALKINEDSQDKKFMDKVVKVIKENYNNSNFDITEFIEEMGVSRSLLHKKLQNLAGQSASRFIRTYRLNIARELILKNRINHSLNISEIAYQVGFNDPKYFTRCFTKHFGVSPSSFLEGEDETKI